MLRHLFLVFLSAVLLCSCGSNAVYRIEGKLTNLEDPLVYIVYEGNGDKLIDSVVCVSPGKFAAELNQEGFYSATIYLENRTKYKTVFLEPGQKITITGDARYPLLLQVKGGKINDDLSAFYKKIAPLQKKRIDLIEALRAKDEVGAGDTDMAAKLTNLNHQVEESVMAYICDNPQKEASAVLIQAYFIIPDDTRKLDELLAVLDPKLNDFYLVKEMMEYSTRAKRTALGAEAPDFSVKSIYGRPFSLDSLHSEYKLLAFVAPWCEMCQTNMLYLDQVSSKYKEEDVDVLLVSLDEDPMEVRTFLKQDTISWNVVTDSANQATMLLDLYNVNAIPRCFLIDEAGKIILKTDNGAGILQALRTLLDEEK